MKIKFTLQRPTGPVDLVTTVDSATTVGHLAAFLTAADPSLRGRPVPAGRLTLGLVGEQQLAMNHRQPVAESALRSGTTVSVSVSGEAYSDPQRTAAAVVTIVEGPDAGKEFGLTQGASLIGRDASCEVQLSDSLVSRRHARLNIADVVEIIDMGSANGLVIDEISVPRSILTASDIVQVGDTKLSVRVTRAVPVGDGTAGSSGGFVRSPRVVPRFEGEVFEAPEPPERQRAQRVPVAALLAPVFMGLLLFFVTNNKNSLIFLALSPLMLIGNNVEQRMLRKNDYKKALEEFHEDLASLVQDAQAAVVSEVAARLAEHPSAAEVVTSISNGTPLLWSRRPDADGFGELRLGLGRQPSRSTVELPKLKKSIRILHAEMKARMDAFTFVEGVPVVADLKDGALGLAGPRTQVASVARALLTQVAGLHSPAELGIGLVASATTADDWQWLKWLPHTSTPHSPVSARLLTSSAGASTALVSALEELIEKRSGANSAESATPGVLLIVEAGAPAEHSRLVSLAERGPALGVFVFWLASSVELLPAACRTYLDVSRPTAGAVAGFVRAGAFVNPLELGELDLVTATTLARSLAPLVDLGARAEDESDLPRAVSFLAMAGADLAASTTAVLERWTENRSIITGPCAPPVPPRHTGTLRAILGQSGSDVHAVDLRADGPHALVGGTTGAGKSELLQSWILAMAAAHSPQRLTFLLVDYKGGSAFRDCVDLPHTVGLVTDLSQHLVRRALTSLAAELRHREHLLARHGAKDLMTLEKRGVAEAPPSLVIVVDEFAALVGDVPEFVDGVVNVAQRGRSLGLHLILATQRPAGVIKDNLRANTNLRLALRMSDETDSSDVLGSPEAAFFDPAIPGRAVSKTGPGRLVPFQTAYAGGWSANTAPKPAIHVEELSIGAATVWDLPEEDTVIDAGKTDIRLVVDNIVDACRTAQIELPRKPWLPELGSLYDLADQRQVRSRRIDTELVFGLRDDPETQSQPTVSFSPDRDGNLAVYGTGGSGKSALLRTLAIAAGFTVRGGPCHVYGIDFGARGLAMLQDLPHVGSIISGGDHERITRLLRWLRGLIDERALRYSQVNAGTITDYRTLGNSPDEPRILLLIDGITAFRSSYEGADRNRWLDVFTSIVAEGRPVGIHVVLSSDQRAGLTTALSSSVQSRVVLRMATVEEYGALGVPGDVIPPDAGPGRGVIGHDEVQVAVLGGVMDPLGQANAVKAFGDAMRRNGAAEAPAIRSLPDDVVLEDLPQLPGGMPVLGIASDSLGPATFTPAGGFLISGPPMSGRSTAVHTMAMSLLSSRPDMTLHLFGNPRSWLAGLGFWKSTTSPADAPTVAADLQASLAAGVPTAVFIEGVSEFLNTPADLPLQNLLKAVIAEGQFVVVEGESSGLVSPAGLLGIVKASRTGIALAPEQSEGTYFKASFPRMTSSDRLPGRGFLVKAGRPEIVQLAKSRALTEEFR